MKSFSKSNKRKARLKICWKLHKLGLATKEHKKSKREKLYRLLERYS